MEPVLDRTLEDLGNIVHLEHVNVGQPDQHLATVRSLKHPLYARPLVNRNPAQTTRKYIRGRDAFPGSL